VKPTFREFLLLVISLSPAVGALILYNRLPDTMAMHFDMHNEVNGTMSKISAIIMMAVIAFIPLIMPLFKKFDSQNANNPKSSIAFDAIRFCLAIVLAIAGWSIIIHNLGLAMDVRKLVLIALAVFFIITGNYLPVIKPNFMMGIRTPWTLNNEDNWRKTHRMGGPIMMIGGIVLLTAAFLPIELSIGVVIGVISIIALLPIGYSFLIYKRR
jgi:uncharacterized membrane protein